jgi:uroporphyrinogen-III synthase
MTIADLLAAVATKGPQSKLAFANYLRANQTPGERMMARVLYHLGIEAQPQVPIRGWIVDFYDYENRVVFEVDGPYHEERKAADAYRDAVLTGAGYRVVRLSNDAVRNLMANVAAMAESA